MITAGPKPGPEENPEVFQARPIIRVVPFQAVSSTLPDHNSGQLKASRKKSGRVLPFFRVLPWPGRVLPGSTLTGRFRARARAGSNHYQLVRPQHFTHSQHFIVDVGNLFNTRLLACG